MYEINKLVSVLEKYAPLSISHEVIKNGGYDNSGLIVKSTDTVKKILFTLDLSIESVKKPLGLNATLSLLIIQPFIILSTSWKLTVALLRLCLLFKTS